MYVCVCVCAYVCVCVCVGECVCVHNYISGIRLEKKKPLLMPEVRMFILIIVALKRKLTKIDPGPPL